MPNTMKSADNSGIARFSASAFSQQLENYTAVNEPVLLYKKGSPERVALDSELANFKPVTIPIVIGDKEVTQGAQERVQVSPFEHSRTLAK